MAKHDAKLKSTLVMRNAAIEEQCYGVIIDQNDQVSRKSSKIVINAVCIVNNEIIICRKTLSPYS